MASSRAVRADQSNVAPWAKARTAQLSSLTPVALLGDPADASGGGKIHDFHRMTPVSAGQQLSRIYASKELKDSARATAEWLPTGVGSDAVQAAVPSGSIPAIKPVSAETGLGAPPMTREEQIAANERRLEEQKQFSPVPGGNQPRQDQQVPGANQQQQQPNQGQQQPANQQQQQPVPPVTNQPGNEKPVDAGQPAKPEDKKPTAFEQMYDPAATPPGVSSKVPTLGELLVPGSGTEPTQGNQGAGTPSVFEQMYVPGALPPTVSSKVPTTLTELVTGQVDVKPASGAEAPAPATQAPGTTDDGYGPLPPFELTRPDNTKLHVQPVLGPDGIYYIETEPDGSRTVVDPDGTRTPINKFGIAPPRRTHANRQFLPELGTWIVPRDNPNGPRENSAGDSLSWVPLGDTQRQAQEKATQLLDAMLASEQEYTRAYGADAMINRDESAVAAIEEAKTRAAMLAALSGAPDALVKLTTREDGSLRLASVTDKYGVEHVVTAVDDVFAPGKLFDFYIHLDGSLRDRDGNQLITIDGSQLHVTKDGKTVIPPNPAAREAKVVNSAQLPRVHGEVNMAVVDYVSEYPTLDGAGGSGKFVMLPATGKFAELTELPVPPGLDATALYRVEGGGILVEGNNGVQWATDPGKAMTAVDQILQTAMEFDLLLSGASLMTAAARGIPAGVRYVGRLITRAGPRQADDALAATQAAAGQAADDVAAATDDAATGSRGTNPNLSGQPAGQAADDVVPSGAGQAVDEAAAPPIRPQPAAPAPAAPVAPVQQSPGWLQNTTAAVQRGATRFNSWLEAESEIVATIRQAFNGPPPGAAFAGVGSIGSNSAGVGARLMDDVLSQYGKTVGGLGRIFARSNSGNGAGRAASGAGRGAQGGDDFGGTFRRAPGHDPRSGPLNTRNPSTTPRAPRQEPITPPASDPLRRTPPESLRGRDDFSDLRPDVRGVHEAVRGFTEAEKRTISAAELSGDNVSTVRLHAMSGKDSYLDNRRIPLQDATRAPAQGAGHYEVTPLGTYDPQWDSERKILEQLGGLLRSGSIGRPDATTKVRILVDRPAGDSMPVWQVICPSCKSIMRQFREEFGIDIEVRDMLGRTLPFN